MIRDTFDAIVKKQDVRQNLSLLRQELKEGNNKHALLFYIGKQYNGLFLELLGDEDAKTRKNTALLIGELGIQEMLEPLYKAYMSESKLFVKSSYLVAIERLNYVKLMPELKKRLEVLSQLEVSEENRKHHNEEIRALSDMIILMEGVKAHEFTGFHLPANVILLTNRNHISVTMDEIPESFQKKAFNAGVQVKALNLDSILGIRTYSELLFQIPGMLQSSSKPEEIATLINDSKLMEFLLDRHAGTEPFYFRVEVKSRMDLSKKATFTKKLSAAIEQKTNRKLINSTSHYEIELRFIENKGGLFNILVKLYTIKDERFAYREESVAASIRPVNAALTVALTKGYQKENAQILDPFCGVGTMLIERHKSVKANTMYGLDTYGEAIRKAKINTENAHQIIHYINRDFFDFTHEYLFDEVITNMPFVQGHTREEEIKELYKEFFQKIKIHLKEDAVLILYSHDKGFVRKYGPAAGFVVVEEYEISMKEGTYVFVLKMK